MKFAEIDLFGVYVAPMSLLMVAAWVITIALRRVAGRFDLLRYVWQSGAVCVCRVYYRSVIDGAHHRTLSATCLKPRQDERAASRLTGRSSFRRNR